jgi:hypothetical protein
MTVLTMRPPASFDSQIHIYTAHQQTTTCFKIDFFLNFVSRNFKMMGDGNHDDRHDDRHDDDRDDDDEQV